VTTYVVDASAAVKWFVEEEYSHHAGYLLQPNTIRLAPDFILVEFAHVALKLIRRGELSADDARMANVRLTTVIDLQRTTRLIRSAFEIAMTFDRSAYDSLYVALALRRSCQLVTADRRLYNALAPSLPETMLWIEDIPTDIDN
jgi:predicted nucleic acid-binding protein